MGRAVRTKVERKFRLVLRFLLEGCRYFVFHREIVLSFPIQEKNPNISKFYDSLFKSNIKKKPMLFFISTVKALYLPYKNESFQIPNTSKEHMSPVKEGGAGAAPPENFSRPRPFKTRETSFLTLGNAFLNAGNVLSQKALFTLGNFLSKSTIERGCPNLRSPECIEIDKNLYKIILGSYYIEIIFRHNHRT